MAQYNSVEADTLRQKPPDVGFDNGVSCPVCGSSQTAGRFKKSAKECAAVLVPTDEDPDRHADLIRHIEGLWGRCEVEIRHCPKCRFGFAHPYVAGDPEFYRLSYLRRAYPSIKWEFTRTIEALRKMNMAKESRAILELGAGEGFFLDLITPQLIPKERCWATEYHPDSQAELSSKGYRALDPDFLARQWPADELPTDGQFDTIFLFQVLEHMDNTREVFIRLRELLCPGGSVFIAVPSTPRIDFNEANGSLFDTPPAHIGRWRPESFQAAAEASGLTVAATEYEPFKLSKYCKDDAYLHHRARSLKEGSIAGAVRSIGHPSLRRYAIIADSILAAPIRVPVWLRAARHKALGGALWVHLIKAEFR